MAKRNQFGFSLSGKQLEFVERALANVPGMSRGGIARRMVVKWAEGVLGEKCPESSNHERYFSRIANPNGLSATAKRMGITPAELRKRLLKEGLARMSNGTAASAAE